MRIQVDRVSETPEELRFALGSEWWSRHYGGEGELAGAFVEPLTVRLHVHRMGEDLFLDGEVRGELELACGRCATRYRQPIREPLRLLLEPAGSRVPADPEGAEGLAREGLYLSDELEHGWFGGSEFRLDRWVKEAVALGTPVQPLCREDCRGLCPRCGTDLNLERCTCEPEVRHSPFDVLRQLKQPGPDKA